MRTFLSTDKSNSMHLVKSKCNSPTLPWSIWMQWQYGICNIMTRNWQKCYTIITYSIKNDEWNHFNLLIWGLDMQLPLVSKSSPIIKSKASEQHKNNKFQGNRSWAKYFDWCQLTYELGLLLIHQHHIQMGVSTWLFHGFTNCSMGKI